MSTFSRRGFLAGSGAGLGSLALPLALYGREASFDCDAVVIGAGAAGLAAARELENQGKTFVLIDARQRIGGRVFTDTSLGTPFDAGATFIHFADDNPWRKIAGDLGFETVSSRSLGGERRNFVNGAPLTPQIKPASYRELQSYFDADEDDVPDVSFVERFADMTADLQQGAVTLARMDVGEEAERVSALDYARLWDGPDFLVPAGFGRLVAAYGQDLPVKLSTRASAIDWSGAGVAVTTNAGRIRARAAIITVSVGVLASGALRFVPQLPQETQAGIDGLGMGALTKVALAFDGNRFDVPIETEIVDSDGARAGFEFDCWPFDRNIVVAWFGGDQARALARSGERNAVATVLDHFATVVGSDARSHFTGGRLCAWSTDPLTMGCYSHALPGHADARALLAAPVAERLYFAGEATGGAPDDDFGPAMTAGGAFLAGQAAAREIAEL
jgi:monoamine oxidase